MPDGAGFSHFRIYYHSGDGFATHDDVVETAPSYGILVILQKRTSDGRWYISSNAPYYLFDGKEWLHFYENDLVDYAVHQLPIPKLIVGRMVNKGLFTKAYDQAKEDRNQMG